MRSLVAALFLAAPAVVSAATLTLVESKGCIQKDTHSKRLGWIRIALTALQQRDAGTLTPEMAAAGQRAAELVAETTRSDCRTLNGEYRVLERATLPDGMKVIKVRVTGTEALWVMAD